MRLEEKELLRFSRNILVSEIGPAGQKKIRNASVLVVGAGGLGSPVIFYLASAGIGRLGIIDHDRVDITNLQRQILYGEDDVGKPKVDVASEMVRRVDPSIEVIPMRIRVTPENVCEVVRGYDVVVDGTDTFGSKFLLNDGCVIERVPLVHSGVLRFGGQVMTILPGESPCLRCLLPEVPSRRDAPTCSEVGIVGAVAGLFGSIQAAEVIKFIVGAGELLTGRILSIDALTWAVRELEVERNASCPVCGDRPRIKKPLSSADYAESCVERG